MVVAEQLVFTHDAVLDVDAAAASAAPQDGPMVRRARVLKLGIGVRVNGGGEVDVAGRRRG